jgi:hypothetical protein
MYSLEAVRPIVVEQNAKRKHWDTQDSSFVGNYLREEFHELEQAFWPDQLDRWEIASEIGDIGYLMIRYQEQMKKEGIEEMPADLFFFWRLAQNVSQCMDINFGDAIFMKAVRNDLKYPFAVTSGFESYEEGRAVSKNMWAQMGGDKAFYKWYESAFGKI